MEKNRGHEEKIYPMEEKIFRSGMKLFAKCILHDVRAIMRDEEDPKLAESFNDFIDLLREAGEKKMYSSRENALKKLR